MNQNVYFIEPTGDALSKDPPWELFKAILELLKAGGYTLNHAREDTYLFAKIKEAIREKGITYFTNTVHLMEGVLPDGTPREMLVDNLRYMVRNIQVKDELLLIDPYLFPKNADPDYVPYLEKLVETAISNITRLEIATKPDLYAATQTAFVKMVLGIKPGISVNIKLTDVFHDRFWIADRSRGVFVGTSLNGVGKRYSLVDYLREEDVKDICTRYMALP